VINSSFLSPLTFPNGATKHVSLGPDAACYKGSLSLQGAKSTLRYLNAVSASFPANGIAGRTFIMNLEQATKELTWAIVVTLLGLPAEPAGAMSLWARCGRIT
jgi:hypothetical protein